VVNRITFKGMIVVAACVLLFSSSCTFFFSPLHGRENNDDPQSQIYNLFAAQTGEGEVTASFTWRSSVFDYDEEEKIEEAVLVYNVGEALPVRSIPLPPDSGGTVGYEDKDGTYSYSKIIEGVSEGEKVWFALYPRTKKAWLAPLYESVEVRDYATIPITGPFIQAPINVYAGSSSGGVWKLSTSDNYILSNDGTHKDFVIFQFDLPRRISCTQARLRLPIHMSEYARAYPVAFEHIEHMNGDEVMQLVDTAVYSEFIMDDSAIGVGTGNADIADALNKAVVYETNMIMIIVNPPLNINVTYDGTEQMNVTYVQY